MKESTEKNKNNFREGTSDKSMLIFTYGSTQGNPDPTRSATVIEKQGLKSVYTHKKS